MGACMAQFTKQVEAERLKSLIRVANPDSIIPPFQHMKNTFSTAKYPRWNNGPVSAPECPTTTHVNCRVLSPRKIDPSRNSPKLLFCLL